MCLGSRRFRVFWVTDSGQAAPSQGTGESIAALLAPEGPEFEVIDMSAIGMSAPRGKGFAISAYADIGQGLRFERQQSLALRNMEWEDRVEPLLPWSTLIMRGVGVVILASTFLAILI
jgi:hypothetical protein